MVVLFLVAEPSWQWGQQQQTDLFCKHLSPANSSPRSARDGVADGFIPGEDALAGGKDAGLDGAAAAAQRQPGRQALARGGSSSRTFQYLPTTHLIFSPQSPAPVCQHRVGASGVF